MNYYLLDNNLFNFAVTGSGGNVIRRLNESISRYPELRQRHTAFCMTPFTLLEALGTKLPNIDIEIEWRKGKSAGETVSDVVARAKQKYLALAELQQDTIIARIQDRRAYIPVECQDLFDICVTEPGSRPETPTEVANVLAWDYALKATYPKNLEQELRHFFFTIILAAQAAPMISRFRIIKRVWDDFYRARKIHVPRAAKGIEEANRAMRLKTTRDFVDCDLLHLACYGWGDDDVVAFTCDSPDVICKRVSIYKGVVATALSLGEGQDLANLPRLRDGRIAFCKSDGEITDLVRVMDLPTIL